jgi:putative phosphotransacetylase
MITVPIEVSARHCHLSQKDLDVLFGEGYELTSIKDLSQRKQYAAKEVVEVQTPVSWGVAPHMDFTFGKAPDHNQIRILGPVRENTQVELSWSDCIAVGIEPRVLVSGDWERSVGGLILVGPKGEVKLERGIIVPQRHIHCNSQKASELGMRHGQIVSVKVLDDSNSSPLCSLTFHNVIIRTHPTFDWQMHIDTDEGNAAGIKMMGKGEVCI